MTAAVRGANPHGCVTLRGGAEPLDATNRHGNLTRNLNHAAAAEIRSDSK